MRTLSRRFRVGPFFKALLISIAVEVVVLLLTLNALASSMMRHSAAAPRPPWEDLLANIGLGFHLVSILIVTPFGLIFAAPLVQLALMTCVLGLFFRARERARLR
ncbi:MAG TPA: hypothetical protein VGC87_24760 [Pyrinomonadaceae bacterium]